MEGSQRQNERVIVVERGGNTTLGWVIAGLLAVIATGLFLHLDTAGPGGVAYGQGAGRVGARGIQAFTGQIARNTYGLFMMDVDNATIWCYEFSPQNRALRLVAARSWHFDRYLEEFNVADPTPKQVAELVEKQRSHRQAQVGTAVTADRD